MPLTHIARFDQPSLLRPTASRVQSALQFLLLAFAGSLVVALCSHIAVPLPFTPVPFTLQPFAVLLIGMLMGPAAGFAAMALYLLEGAAGMPVFTPLGLPGIARLLGPTGGYLFAYPLAAAIAGAGSSLPRLTPFARNVVAGSVALAAIYTCGALWFSHVLKVSFAAAMASAVAPFALSDMVKVCAASGIASALRTRGN